MPLIPFANTEVNGGCMFRNDDGDTPKLGEDANLSATDMAEAVSDEGLRLIELARF